jgi:hypothetical protein
MTQKERAKAKKAAENLRLRQKRGKIASPGHRPFEMQLDRADEQLDALIDELGSWNADVPYELRDKVDPTSKDRVVTIEVDAGALPKFSMLIGECLQSLRSTLDYFAHDLAGSFSGRTLAEPVAKGTEFPIFGDRAMTPRERTRKVGALDPRAQAKIDRMQPVTRGPAFGEHPLWWLHELNNIDKHRIPLAVATTPDSITVAIRAIDMGFDHITYEVPQTLEGEARILSYRPLNPATRVVDQTRVRAPVELSLVFGPDSPVPHQFVLWTLREIRRYIADKVIKPLRPYLD